MSRTMLCTAVIFSMLLLTSCSKSLSIKPPELSGDMSLSGELKCGDVTASADFSRSGDVWTVTFTAPDSVSGMVITDEGDKCTVTYSGIIFDYNDSEVPFKTAVGYITDSLDAAAKPENISVKQEGEGMRVSGSIPESGFIINLDKSGNITAVNAGGSVFTAADNTAGDISDSTSGNVSENASDGMRETPQAAGSSQPQAESVESSAVPSSAQ